METARAAALSPRASLHDRIVPESARTMYFPALDGVRALAVAMVMLSHFLPAIAVWGWLGVQVFFVLSGFLITGILFDTRDHRRRFRDFYVRRALRIFPLYYGVLLVLSAALLLSHGHAPPHFWLWFVYVQNFFWLTTKGLGNDVLTTAAGHGFAAIGHFWSLAVEEQFYLLWPPLVFFVRDRRRLMQLCLGLIVFRVLLAAYWQVHLPPATLATGITYRMLPTQCDGFLMGGLLALWTRGNPSPRAFSRSSSIAAAAMLLFAALMTVLHLRPGLIGGQNVFSYTSAFQATIGLPLSNLASLAFIFAVLQPGSWAYRLCHLAPMRSLGRVSYGLYVFHLPMYVLSGSSLLRLWGHPRSLQLDTLGHSAQALLMTLLVSYASFHLYEKRFLLLKNRFTSVRNTVQKQAAAHPL